MEEKFIKNTMDFGEEKENFTVNEDAERVIKESSRKKAEFKKESLIHLLDILNDICDKNQIQYFAVGKLLGFWRVGQDLYPDDSTYEVRMLRDDYDVFTKYLDSNGNEYQAKIKTVYDKAHMVKNPSCSIANTFHREESGEMTDLTIRINIIPLDVLPKNPEERDQFRREVAVKNRDFRASCRDYRTLYNNKNISVLERIKRKVNVLRNYPSDFFEKQHEDLYKLYTRYNDQNTGSYGRLENLLGRVEKSEDIQPISRVVFGSGHMMVPANVKEFYLDTFENYISHFRSVQTRTLKRFNDFCEKNDITYFAMGPLLVECVSHISTETEELRNWKVGLLRKDYDKVMNLLSREETAMGLVLKLGQDEYPMIPRKEAGFICKEDDREDVTGKNYQVLMEAFDYMPSDIDKVTAAKNQLRGYRNTRDILVKEEKGLVKGKSKKTVQDIDREIHIYASSCGDEASGKLSRLVTGYGKTIAQSELLPVKKRDFRGFSMSIPANEYLWFKGGDKQFSDSIVREKTKLLGAFHDMCQKENIEYFAVAKLLIGAAVYQDTIPNSGHQAFHVGLIRKDYDNLLKLLRENGSKYNMSLSEYFDKERKFPREHKYVSFVGKENSRETVFIEPFDKLPESFYLRRAFRRQIQEMNDQYKEMLLFKLGSYERFKSIYTEEEIEAKKAEYAHVDLLEKASAIETLAQKYNDDPQAYSYERVAFGFSRIIEEEDLYPLHTMKFRDIEINCPRDYSVWQPIQDEDLLFQVKCIQEKDKLLLKELDRVCQELGIGYFVCGGTMLGYMRHKGFIPWDDDVDVAMLRADYDKFLAEAGPLLREKFFLQTRETDPNIPYLFSKLRIDDTEYVTKYNENRNFHKGLCLDIFPFDYVPNDLKEREKFVNEVIALSKEHNKVAGGQLEEYPEPFPPRNEEERRIIEEEKAAIKEDWNISLKDTQKKYIDKATMYNDKAKELGLKTVASFVPSYTYIDIADLLPYQRGMFEDVEVYVPKRPDIFLEMQYGDFMQLPPLHARVAHRLVRWSDGVNSGDNTKKRNYEVKE